MSNVLDLQVYSLLSRLRAETEASCTALRAAATEQSRQLVAEARGQARSRIKEAVLEKRRRVAEHCRQVRVRLEARHRDEDFAGLGKRLDDGLDMLPDALAARWSDEASRRRWCGLIMQVASTTLLPGSWRIEVAPGMSPQERDELAAGAARVAGTEVIVEDQARLRAGIAIVCEGVRLDGTTTGLLSVSVRVKAALLAELGASERPS